MKTLSKLSRWLLAAAAVVAVGAFIRAHAVDVHPQTTMVAMGDSVHLATDVYLPTTPPPYPVVVVRTPYNKATMGSLGQAGTQNGYAVVVQDTRGRFASEGQNLPFVGDNGGDHRDGYDTLEWVAKQPWCNGKIGTMGGSALGITQIGEAGSGTTRLTCQQITVAPPSMYEYGVFPGGVFRKNMIEGWIESTHHAPESVAWWTAHPDYDAFWKQRDMATHWGNANAPAVHIGGWYDIFSQGTIDNFNGFQQHGGPKARGAQKLVMGPWTHSTGQDTAGQLTFPDGATPPNHATDPGLWFEAYLKGKDTGAQKLPAVTYYVMGDVTDRTAPGNVWRTADAWPPVKAKETDFYLHADHTLGTESGPSAAQLTYAYDPANPAPTVGGHQLILPGGPIDQRSLEARPDVLVFTGATLAAPLEVTGCVQAHLWVSSDCPDTDFFVKLCDVYPDGRSINICEGQLRARFREGFEHERLMKPGTVYPLMVDLWSTSMIFNRGHRLRVQVTSSSDPGFDPNPNTGAPFRADKRTQIAHNTIYVDTAHGASSISLPIVLNHP